MDKIDYGRYCLRYAAGQYWLVDIKQNGIPYRVPLMINGVGAKIWHMMESGMEIEQMSEAMCRTYGISKEEAQGDIIMFQEELKKQGYLTEE